VEKENILAANHFLAVVLLGEHLEGGLNDTTSQAEDKVQCALYNRGWQMYKQERKKR
jgi:hypothetical protein